MNSIIMMTIFLQDMSSLSVEIWKRAVPMQNLQDKISRFEIYTEGFQLQ